MIKQIPEQAKDGTLSEVMQLPVHMWRIRRQVTDLARNRRETTGSGDGTLPYDDDYDEEDDEYDEEYDASEREGITDAPPPKQKLPVDVEEHQHRHHHGENAVEPKVRHICGTLCTSLGLYSLENLQKNQRMFVLTFTWSCVNLIYVSIHVFNH